MPSHQPHRLTTNNDKKENGEIPRSKTINKIVNLKTLEIDNPNPVYPVEDEEKNKDENEEVDHEKEENMTNVKVNNRFNNKNNAKLMKIQAANENMATLKKLLMEVINFYMENELTMSKEEIYSLIPIAFVEEVDIYKKLLDGILKDISDDNIFDPMKVKQLAKIILAGFSSSETKLQGDDVMMCIKHVLGKISDLNIDEKNENLQISMDALCDLLFVANAYLQITGVTNEKKEKIKESLKYLQEHGLETITKKLTKTSNDPSLRMKHKYVLESLNRIGGTKYEKWEGYQKLLESSIALALTTTASVFTGNVISVASCLERIKKDYEKFVSIGQNLKKFSMQEMFDNLKKQLDVNDSVLTSQNLCQKISALTNSVSDNWYDRANELRTVEMLSIN